MKAALRERARFSGKQPALQGGHRRFARRGRAEVVKVFKHGKERSARCGSANSSPRPRPRGSNLHALPRQHRRTRHLQFCRRPRFHDDPRGKARPVDVTAARAGGGREFVLMRKPDARKVWNLRVHPGGPVRHQGQLYTRKGGLGVPLSRRAFTMASPRSSASWAVASLFPSKMVGRRPSADGVFDFRHDALPPYTASALTSSR